MPRIRNVDRKSKGNRYCGPSAISAVTKLDTDQAAALIRARHNLRSVKGTSHAQVWDILRLCGYRVGADHTYAKKQQPTLAGWLSKTIALRKPGRVFLVVAGNHWQLIEGRRYVCGIVGEVVSVKHEKVKRRARVKTVYEIVGDYRHPVEALAKIATEKKQKRAVTPTTLMRREVMRAQREGLVEWDFWSDACLKVEPPSIIYPGNWFPDGVEDPYEGDHTTDSWEAAAELVNIYRALYEKHRVKAAA